VPRLSRADALALFVPFAVYVIASSLLGAWIIDDAGITFAYARNVAHGYGFVSQPGRPPVEGFSDPLWLLLLVPFHALHVFHPVVVPKLLGAAFVLGGFRVLQRALSHATGSVVPGFFVAMFLAASPPLAIWCASGLENGLLLFLVSVLYALAVLRPARWQLASGVVTGLIAMTRPEGITLAAAGVAMVLGDRLARRATTREALASVAAYARGLAYVLLPFLAWRLAVFERWLPHTYYAKRSFMDASERLAWLADHPEDIRNKLVELGQGLAGGAGLWLLGAVGIAVVELARRRRLRADVGAGAAILGVSIATFVWMDDDWMGELRFGTVVVAATWITAVTAAYALLPSPASSTRTAASAALMGLCATVGLVSLGAPRLVRFAGRPPAPYADKERSFALKLNSYADALGARDGSVLIPDCGAMLMDARLRVLDAAGLFEPDVVRTLKHDGTRWLFQHPDFYDWVFESAKPTFIVTHDFWTYVTAFEKDPRFTRDYVAIDAYPDRYVESTYKESLHSGVYVRKDALHSPGDLERVRASYAPAPYLAPLVDRLRAAFGVDPAGPHATDAELRKLGLAARYEQQDPDRAATILARLAERNPRDLDAQLELAQALDAALRADEARPVWVRALDLARLRDDRAHVKMAADRLRGSSTEATDAEERRLMQAGLDALYRDRVPARAVDVFRQVLALDPEHYGATYQLAAALDAAGRTDEARALWSVVLDRANRLGDKKTAQDVSARIAARP
jgi:tetratricopeptide (TPR) repeat protein